MTANKLLLASLSLTLLLFVALGLYVVVALDFFLKDIIEEIEKKRICLTFDSVKGKLCKTAV